MRWEPWAKAEPRGLARYVTEDAVHCLILPESRFDLVQRPNGRYQLIQTIYQALVQQGIRYAVEKYSPEDAVQRMSSGN